MGTFIARRHDTLRERVLPGRTAVVQRSSEDAEFSADPFPHRFGQGVPSVRDSHRCMVTNVEAFGPMCGLSHMGIRLSCYLHGPPVFGLDGLVPSECRGGTSPPQDWRGRNNHRHPELALVVAVLSAFRAPSVCSSALRDQRSGFSFRVSAKSASPRLREIRASASPWVPAQEPSSQKRRTPSDFRLPTSDSSLTCPLSPDFRAISPG